MKQRCNNSHTKSYKDYGGRGITVCKEWHEFSGFYAYLIATIGIRPSEKYSLDRINNDGNYEPGNIRWATRLEQRENRRPRVAHLVHGTTNGYHLHKCRCDLCRQADNRAKTIWRHKTGRSKRYMKDIPSL